MSIRIKTIILGMVRTNCYIVVNNDTKEAVVFDPADQFEVIEQYIENEDLQLRGILLTHGHFDHILAANELRDKYGVKLYAGEAEKNLLADASLNASGPVGLDCVIDPDVLLADGEEVILGGMNIRAIHTPGHTAGGTCYYFEGEEVLISGDTLFHNSIGRTDLPTGDFNTLIASIKDKLFLLPDDTIVYTGHADSTTIRYEKLHNQFLI